MIVLDNEAEVLRQTRLYSKFKDISLADLKKLADNQVHRRWNKLKPGDVIFFRIKDNVWIFEIKVKSIVKIASNYGYNPSAECHIDVTSILYDKGDDTDILLFDKAELQLLSRVV